MTNSDHFYSRKEISKILSKASEIQKQKDLYGEKDGLTEQEILDLADEVGIDKASLMEAMRTFDEPELDQNFKWFNITSKIQEVAYGDMSSELWDDVIHEIRKVTGGIGKASQTGKSFEWEQRRKEFGYKHISFTPENGKTKIQYVHNWTSLKISLLFIFGFFGFISALLLSKGMGLPKSTAAMYAPFGGLITLTGGLVYLKYHFGREKRRLKNMINAISRKINSSPNQQITIEDEDVYSTQEDTTRSKNKTT